MVSAWKRLHPVVRVVLIVLAILVLWAIVGMIPISQGGTVGPVTRG